MFTKPKPISPSSWNALLSETKSRSPSRGSGWRNLAERFKLESAWGELVVPHDFNHPCRKRLKFVLNESPGWTSPR
jgi:hypothetical protein